MLYMRLPNGSRSCLSCHGADPGANPNNILRGADNPVAITKALSTVGAMGFLNTQLLDADRADIAAFLGSVLTLVANDQPLRIWPVTLESGAASTGTAAAVQWVRIANVSSQPQPVGSVTINDARHSLSHDCPAVLPAGAACRALVRMQASGAGWMHAAVKMESMALPRPFFAGASVFASTSPVSTLVVANGDLDAPIAATAGVPVRRRIALHNPGPMPASVDGLLVLGPQASQFRVEQGCAVGTILQAGVSCELEVSYSPNLLPSAQALLRVRTDQGFPQALLLLGNGSSAIVTPPPDPAPAPGPVPGVPEAGGGCSMRSTSSRPGDAALLLLAAVALAALWRRRSAR